jgi:hypothetical protein
MANPNLLVSTSVTQDILAEAQLASGNNDYAVPTGKSWTIKSINCCNVSGSTVTLNFYVIKSGGTARQITKSVSLVAADTYVLDPNVVAMLPEGATLRINSSAATAVDLMVTGVVTA